MTTPSSVERERSPTPPASQTAPLEAHAGAKSVDPSAKKVEKQRTKIPKLPKEEGRKESLPAFLSNNPSHSSAYTSDDRGSKPSSSKKRGRSPEREEEKDRSVRTDVEEGRSVKKNRTYSDSRERTPRSSRQDSYQRSYSASSRSTDSDKPAHSFTIQNRREAPYLDWIRNGTKKAECRVNTKAFSRLKVGDTVQFHNRHEGILCRISFLHTYNSFQEMVTAEGVENIVPHVYRKDIPMEKLIQKAVRVYEGFPGAERVRTFGAIAIGLTYLCEYFKGQKSYR